MMAPRISVFSISKNNGNFLEETLNSIFMQTFDDFEIILVDGNSVDQTREILQSGQYDNRLRWISEPDHSPIEAFHKAIQMCSGDYIMCMPVSDIYLRKTWFQECVAFLDSENEISLVHGFVKLMDEHSSPIGPKFPNLDICSYPSAESFFSYWLATYAYISELTYCVRRDVFFKCWPPCIEDQVVDYKAIKGPLTMREFQRLGPLLFFIYEFNKRGYLTKAFPYYVSAARVHSDSLSSIYSRYLMLEGDLYTDLIREYRSKLLSGFEQHTFLDGKSQTIDVLDVNGIRKQILQYRKTGFLYFGQHDDVNMATIETRRHLNEKGKYWVTTFSPQEKVLIYAAGRHTRMLFATIQHHLEQLNIVSITDQNPECLTLCGYPVIPLDNVDFRKYDRIIISSKAFETEIYEQLAPRIPAEKIELIYGDNS